MFTQGCAFWGSRWRIITFRGPKSPKTPILRAWIGTSSQICEKFKYLYLQICVSDWHEIWQQLRPATVTSWVVSYGGKTIPRWRTAAILKIDISPYLSEKSSDFHAILYTAAYFKLDERHVIKNEKVALDRLRVRQNVFLVICNSDGVGENTWSTYSENGNKTAKINVRNFHGSLTTVVMAQNDTSKTANIFFSVGIVPPRLVWKT